MYLHVIVAYFLLFWWPDARPIEPWFDHIGTCLAFVLVKPALFFLAGAWMSAGVRRVDGMSADRTQRMQHRYHWGSFVLSVATVLAFAADIGLTTWPELARGLPGVRAIPGMADVVILLPFFASLVLLWIASYPVDRSVREATLRVRQMETPGAPRPAVWSLGGYLLFQIRHQLLIAAVPMTLILVAFRWAEQSRDTLVHWLRVPWASQLVLGLAALLVFVLAPVMLRYIWSTEPLPDGPLRRRLEELCRQIGLRYREILIWRSQHMMVNAAVMGLFPRVRYILLSDALLDSLGEPKIVGVFGHEAGHVRLHHIPYFLLFATCGMLLVSGFVEILIRISDPHHPLIRLSDGFIETAGFVGVLVVWGIGFGWISRRFERQADLYGARCLTQLVDRCDLPCGRHPGGLPGNPDALCATAAGTFVETLDRVAVLNGIPHDERSWRHSSMASRMQFLRSLAGDVARLRMYDRLIHWVKAGLWAGSLVGLAIAGWYIHTRPEYRAVVRYNFITPFVDDGSPSPNASESEHGR
ncbi:MAG: M48 family metalloprotease [Phycisphaerae bacterium]|nr:M48 family metalloprotease [Phycisphaerae bacterium]